MNHTDFYILDNDKKVIKVTVIDDTAIIKHYEESVFYPFYRRDSVTIEEVTAFLESRCFDKNRPDRDTLLSHLKLDSYDVWAIARKTNGKMAHDHISVEFV